MPDKKISELDAITGSATAADDFFIVVDSSGASTNKISRAELNNAIEQDVLAQVDITSANIDGGTIDNTPIGSATPSTGVFTDLTATGTASIAGVLSNVVEDTTPQLGGNLDTNGNNINFGDNDKAIFGAGSDLQIWHNGADSYVVDNGTGDLILKGASNIKLQAASTNEDMITATSNGAVELYYDGGTYTTPKLATTATGVDVQGSVTADGLTVDGQISQTGTAPAFTIVQTDTTDLNTRLQVNGQSLLFNTINDALNSTTPRLKLNNSSGDISFYSSDGLSQGLYWDASTQRLGLGTTSPESTLTVRDSGAEIRLDDASNNPVFRFMEGGTSKGKIETTAGDMRFYAGGVLSANRYMTITSGGNVGIGTSSPDRKFHIETADNIIGLIESTDADAWLAFKDNTSSTDNAVRVGATGDNLRFYAGSGERMRIDSSGNVLVGRTNAFASTVTSGGGSVLNADGLIEATKNGVIAMLNRNTTDGEIVQFRKAGATVGSIGVVDGDIPFFTAAEGTSGLKFDGDNSRIAPCNGSGAILDNTVDLGSSGGRFDDIYATNGTIQTSDANEKQDIEELSDAEQRVAVAAKGLLRKYRWKDSVAEKGDDARIHFGIIAQDLKAAFEAEGLDAGRYAMFIHSEWTDEETGEQKSRMGIRYNQLLAFIIAAI